MLACSSFRKFISLFIATLCLFSSYHPLLLSSSLNRICLSMCPVGRSHLYRECEEFIRCVNLVSCDEGTVTLISLDRVVFWHGGELEYVDCTVLLLLS